LRSWLKAANDEKYTRGPNCFIHAEGTQHNFLYQLKNKIRIKPSTGFFFFSEVLPGHIDIRYIGIHFVFVYIICLF